MLLSPWMTSGAVPPNRATVRLYQVPMPRQRSSVGNSSLIIAGAVELVLASRPKQNTSNTDPKPASGWISVEIGAISSPIALDHTSSCGLRPNWSAVQPKGYCRTTNIAVAIDSAQNTMASSSPLPLTANGVKAEKEV